jgi:hypothetical protein
MKGMVLYFYIFFLGGGRGDLGENWDKEFRILKLSLKETAFCLIAL